LTLGEDQVATHEDINDRAQTVYVIEVDPTNSTGPSTSATPLSPTPAEASNTSTVPSSAGALPTDAGNTPPGSGYLPSTGVSSTTGPMAITAILALMCGTGLLLWGRTRTSRQH
ncbi:LPXTG cell wall anchor domain-containing protein, partial [Nakamurella silvestris]